MELFHGSNQIIRTPDILKGRKFLDFGSGFYLSDEKKQAENRAQSAVAFFDGGVPTVNIFEWDKAAPLITLFFPFANIEWLDFVISNRRGEISETQYDIVIGPTADDKTILVIDQFMEGMYDNLENPKKMIIQLLQPQKLATQYLFATNESLNYLRFINSYII
jgi:hypothetical protein